MIYSHIMVAVDGSTTSILALREAIHLTQDQKAILRILYVVDESIVNYIESYVDFDTLWNAYKEEGYDLLTKLGKEAEKANINFETCLVELKPFEGRLAEKILIEAKSWPADLLVVGTHGRRGVSHFFLGSVAESIIRIATLPILLVRGK